MIYNSQHSFVKFKDIGEFKELSLDSLYKKLNYFHKKFTKLKNASPQAKTNENLKEKVLDNVRDLFNELYYIYKDKYNEEIDSLNTKDTKKSNYKKLRLTDEFHYEPEEKKNKSVKNLIKKNHLKNQQKLM